MAAASEQHSQFGITIRRPQSVSSVEVEQAFLPPLLPPSPDAERLGHTVPPLVNHDAAPPILAVAKQGAESRGESLLASLLARAEIAAIEHARSREKEKRETSSTSDKRRSKKTTLETFSQIHSEPYSAPLILFTDADKLDDQQFIRATMDGDYHRDEMKRLFFAKDGQSYLDRGLLYAAAFEVLRKDCIRRVAEKRGKAPQAIPVPSRPTQVFVPGMPTLDELIARATPEEAAKKRRESYRWAGIRHRL